MKVEKVYGRDYEDVLYINKVECIFIFYNINKVDGYTTEVQNIIGKETLTLTSVVEKEQHINIFRPLKEETLNAKVSALPKGHSEKAETAIFCNTLGPARKRI